MEILEINYKNPEINFWLNQFKFKSTDGNTLDFRDFRLDIRPIEIQISSVKSDFWIVDEIL